MFGLEDELHDEIRKLKETVKSLQTALRPFAQADRFKSNGGTDGLIITVDTENEHPELHFCCVEDIRTAEWMINRNAIAPE